MGTFVIEHLFFGLVLGVLAAFRPPVFDEAEMMGTDLPHCLTITNPEDLAGAPAPADGRTA